MIRATREEPPTRNESGRRATRCKPRPALKCHSPFPTPHTPTLPLLFIARSLPPATAIAATPARALGPQSRIVKHALSRLPPAQHEKHRLTPWRVFVQAESLSRKKQRGAQKAAGAASEGDENARATASLPPPPTFQFPQPSLQPARNPSSSAQERAHCRPRACALAWAGF